MLLSVSYTTNAQLKIFPSGGIQLGSLQEQGFGLYVAPSGYTSFNPSVYGAYSWSNLVHSTHDFQKNWVVQNWNGTQTFFVYGNGQLYAMGAWFGSDKAFKDNIADIENPLEKVLNLHGVTFNWRPSESPNMLPDSVMDKNGVWHVMNPGDYSYLDSTKFDQKVIKQLLSQRDMKHLGLIAQEVQEVIPELVNVLPNGTYAVEYTAITGLLIEAIKEQQRQIENLSYSGTLSLQKGNTLSGLKSTSTTEGNYLYQNTPNPFNKTTVIKFKVASATDVSIMVFDMQGSLIKTYKGLKSSGEITINGFELKPGMYMYSLVVDETLIDTKRMILTN